MNNSERLPFDAHTIAAALAPRALVVDQGSADPYVNSRGTATVVYPAAKLVYEWLGVGERIGMAIRGGGHCDFAGEYVYGCAGDVGLADRDSVPTLCRLC